jgi:tRNA(Ile2) C34 agmatinyltransferase TiaS
LRVTKLEMAFAANAEAIEVVVSTTNVSVWQALRIAQSDRPRCIVCGEEMTRASRKSVICRRTQECRRISRRYVYLYTERNLTKTEALSKIMTELTGE